MSKPPVARKLAVNHLCVQQLVFWLLVVSSFNGLQEHAVVAAFHIYAQRGEDAGEGEVGGCALNSHGNYIVDHGKIMVLCF